MRVAWKHLVLGTTRNVESVLLSLRNNGEKKDVLNLHSLRRALFVVPQVQVPVEEVDDEELVPTPESARRQPETQVEHTRRFKRKAETDREQLEREIREDSEELLQTNMDFDWFWVGSGEPVLVASLGTLEGPASFAPATSPEMFSGSLDSVCFNRGNEHDFVKMRLGGQDVLGLETGQHHR